MVFPLPHANHYHHGIFECYATTTKTTEKMTIKCSEFRQSRFIISDDVFYQLLIGPQKAADLSQNEGDFCGPDLHPGPLCGLPGLAVLQALRVHPELSDLQEPGRPPGDLPAELQRPTQLLVVDPL